MSACSRHVVPLAVLLVAFTNVTAQSPAPLRQAESIPFELASALISSGGIGSDPQILVGEIPGWVTSKIAIPSGARVVGSAFAGTSVVSILAFPPTADSALTDLRRDLMKTGWLNPPPQPQYNGGGGFRPAQAAQVASVNSPYRFVLCNDQQMLTGTATRKRGASVEVTLRLSTSSQYSACRPAQLSALQRGDNVRPASPTLYNPAGVTDMQPTSLECTDPRFAAQQTWTSYKTTMASNDVLDHYARQLQDSGWKLTPTQGSVVTRAFTRPDSTGTPVETSLIITTPAQLPSCRQITMYTMQIKKP